MNVKAKIQKLGDKRNIAVVGNENETVDYCVEYFIKTANTAIKDHGFFTVALSGGSTPKAIFKKLSEEENAGKVDYTKVLLFWSDERNVAADNIESNYKMAMDAGFGSLPVLEDHVFPMDGTGNLEFNAKAYEALIESAMPSKKFDLVMLGMGDDGHTASLFPNTSALHVKNRLVVANDVPQKKCSRLTLTFDCINQAKNIVIYVLGKGKADMIVQVLTSKDNIDVLPIQGVGTKDHPALYILDQDAASKLNLE